jgi:8-amino-7-oxononanoate synthase
MMDELVNRPAAGGQRYRNTAFVIENTRQNFDSAYAAQIMGIHGVSLANRNVRLADGHQVIDFVRCSYLGLDNHPRVVAGALSAIQKYSSVHWSCARTRLNFELLRDLEARLSGLFGCRVIAFSTVMLANLGALPLLASGHLTGGTKPVMVFDRLCHVSLAYHKPVIADETEVITIRHNDIGALEEICRRHKRVAYIADGVYSMGGFAPIPALQGLQQRYGLFLYIDDAHGISIAGDHGEGYARSQFPRDLGPYTIIAASLGKGYGASGGILMLGTADQEDIFRRYALPYAFSAAPNLAAVGAAMGSADIHETDELKGLQSALRKRIDLFDERIATSQRGDPLPIRLISIGGETDAIRMAKLLLEQGFYTSATFFPTVARGKAGIRVCITATHSCEEIDRLCDAVTRGRGETTSYGTALEEAPV